jgi:hypothetical protein
MASTRDPTSSNDSQNQSIPSFRVNNDGIASFIRSEVRSALQDEIELQHHHNTDVDLPSYASASASEPLLSPVDDKPTNPFSNSNSASTSASRSTPTGTSNTSTFTSVVRTADLEAQYPSPAPPPPQPKPQSPRQKPKRYPYIGQSRDSNPLAPLPPSPKLKKTLAQRLGLAIIWFPLFAWLGLVIAFSATGLIPGRVVPLAAILSACTYGLFGFLLVVYIPIHLF